MDAESVSAWLLANPEARMAVLEKMPERATMQGNYDKRGDALVTMQKRATEAEARLASALGKYGELQKLTVSWSDRARDDSGGDMFDEGIMRCARELKAELAALPFRDQALSAPTAESGKDVVAEFVSERKEQLSRAYDSPLAQSANGYAPSEPAPVAEAEGRVTHKEARVMLQAVRETHSPVGLHWLRLEKLELYRQQQEQSEREAVDLRKELERVTKFRAAEQHALRRRLHNQKTALRQLHSVLNGERKLAAGYTEQRKKVNVLLGINEHVSNPDHVGAIESIVTRHREVIDQMHALRTERNELKAKLSESEQKLSDAQSLLVLSESQRDEAERRLAERDASPATGFVYTASEAEIVSHCVKVLEALSHISLWSDTPAQLLRHQTLRKAESELAMLIGFRRGVYNDGMHPELFSARTPAAQEPTGGEPAKPEPYEPHPAQAADRGAEHYGVREFDPPAAEAPPKFRVGQRVRWIPSGRVFTIAERQLRWVNDDPDSFEPADPAPPKPGDGVTRAGLPWPLVLRDVATELSKPGARNSVPGYVLVDALRLFADRLEREGDGNG